MRKEAATHRIGPPEMPWENRAGKHPQVTGNLNKSALSTAVDKHVGNFPLPHFVNPLKMNGFRLRVQAPKRPFRWPPG
jgi:hypothetical protein